MIIERGDEELLKMANALIEVQRVIYALAFQHRELRLSRQYLLDLHPKDTVVSFVDHSTDELVIQFKPYQGEGRMVKGYEEQRD